MKKLIMVSTILLGTLLFGVSAFASKPSFQLKFYLEKDRCEQAIQIYEEAIAGTSEEDKYIELFLDYVEKQKEVDYRDAVIHLEPLKEISNKKVAGEAKYWSAYLYREGFGDECYKKAETYVIEENFINAMKELQKIDKDYLKYAEVKQLDSFCKEMILNATECVDSVKEIEKNILMLESYFAMVPEPAFATRKAQLEKELEILKDVIERVKNASDAYNAQKYKQAFSILEEGLEKYPDNIKMKEGYFLYLEQYVEMIAEEAQEACDSKEYKKAKGIVEEALAVHDCEPLRLILEHVKEERSILYKWKNDFLEFIEKFK